MRMDSHSRLDDSLREGTLEGLKLTSFKPGCAIVTIGLNSILSVMESIRNKSTATRKVGEVHHRATTSAQNHYLAYMWTKVPQVAHDPTAVSGRRIFRQTVYRHLAD
ncbi:hypothetical protein TNCV_5049881 [Trichonephila clavipes]|nr:hypothetical protein TNCV_5049881 [Trichonephila clavipes]